MRELAGLYNLSFFFFVPIGILYGWFTNWQEPVGLVALPFLGIMGLMIGMYLNSNIKRLDADPADDPRGDQWMQEGEYGFFSPHSWWPLPLAVAAALLFVGLKLGLWVFLVGLVLGILSLLGWTFEYFREDMPI